MSRTSLFWFLFLFFLAAVDFLLRMDFVMLVLVLSLLSFVCRFKEKKRDKGKGLRFGGLLWLSSSDGYK